MVNGVAEWDPEIATVQFLILMLAPIAWMIHCGRAISAASQEISREWVAWCLAVMVGLTSLMTSYLVGRSMVELPPAYHDEYSYLFQAKTLLTGSLSSPGHPTHPELFDQMHVLNEGRMASRYYPGTGLWLAPFVALGHPYWAQWLASAIASVFVFWTGYELGRLRVAVVSGFAFAVSPGVALFANLLLAHQATVMALSIFTWSFVKWQRTQFRLDIFIAGCGLSYAMLCRPATAAGYALPFGLAFLWWLIRPQNGSSPGTGCSAAPEKSVSPPSSVPSRNSVSNAGDLSKRELRSNRLWQLVAIGLPLIAGWCVMLAYNKQVTGSWTTSPYQLYTDLYTPKHVYGFNNATRGEQKQGPKVIQAYNDWASNLTPELALQNTANRLLMSWLWTLDLLPLLMSLVVVTGTAISAFAMGLYRNRRQVLVAVSTVSAANQNKGPVPFLRCERRWWPIGLSIISLHAMHVPYWYIGIMGWHYVFETSLAWCLLLGRATDLLFTDWQYSRRNLLPWWWALLLSVSLAADYFPFESIPSLGKKYPKITKGISPIRHPRREYANFDNWLKTNVTELPALVLIEIDPKERHMDYVVNDPGLNAPILRARYRPDQMNLDKVTTEFPDRHVYLCQPDKKIIKQID
jgi:hypothetical protein